MRATDTDEIKVGDRFLVPVDVQITRPDTTTVVLRDAFGGRPLVVMGLNTKFLSTCQRLPPEIGVGDTVKLAPAIERSIRRLAPCDAARVEHTSVVAAVSGDWALVCDVGGTYPLHLSDLSLVKKADQP